MSCENLEIKQESVGLKEDQNSTSDEENDSDHDEDNPLDVLKTDKNSEKKTKNNNKPKSIDDDGETTTEKSSNDQPCLPGGKWQNHSEDDEAVCV